MAGVKISALPPIVAPALTDIFPEVQPAVSGATYKATLQQVYDLFNLSSGIVNPGLINELAYYNAAGNSVSGLATVNRASLTTNTGGVPTWRALTDGQIIIGSTAGSPNAASLTAGTGITITPGSNTISIASNGANSVVNQTTSSVTMTPNTFYLSNAGASLVTFTLPTSSALGDWIEIAGFGNGGWRIAQATGQQIFASPNATSLGAGGSLSSTAQTDCIRMRCVVANTTWSVFSIQSIGLTIV